MKKFVKSINKSNRASTIVSNVHIGSFGTKRKKKKEDICKHEMASKHSVNMKKNGVRNRKSTQRKVLNKPI